MKAIQTANKGGNSRFSLKNNNYIKLLSNINRTGLFSAFTFILLALTCLFPISKGEQSTEAVTGTAQSSSLTLSVTGDTASVELDVNSTDGTFASSSAANSASFSVVTNNFSGYTLSITGSDNDGKLYDTTKKYFLEPLTSAVSEADFSSTLSLNGKWGYKPSKFNSAANTNYLPAPTTTASTLDKTSVANTTANDYTISLGLRADYGTAANTYTNAFVITAVPNPIAYVITYDANTTDTVSNMPAAQNSTTSATSITLSDKTPAREGYDFKGWCTVAPTEAATDTCTGLTFQPGDTYGIDQTTENITTLYAMWEEQIAGYIQDYTYARCESDAENRAVKVKDKRDDKTYTVRYINGACWMTQNLNFNMVSGMTLDTTTTNVTSSKKIPTVGSLSLRSSNSYTQPYIFVSPDSSYGTYYNYVAATAGTVTGSSNITEASQDICPKGWRLPTRNEQRSIGVGGTYVSTFTPVVAGYYLSGSLRDSGTYGYWWSSTAVVDATDNRYFLRHNASNGMLYSENNSDRYNGFSVRCVKVKPGVTISFNTNGGTGTMGTQSIDAGQSANLTANSFTRTDYIFNGWNTEPDGSGTSYANAATYAAPASEDNKIVVLYAQWKGATMQTYTAAQCQADASSQAVTIKDSRDNKSYKIRYINDVCTMIDNLDFALTTGMTLTPDTTNVTTNRTFETVGSLTTNDNSGSYSQVRTARTGTTGYGTHYNYAAATAGTIIGTSDNTDATEDICPKGWKLPDGHNVGTSGATTLDQYHLANNKWHTWDDTYTAVFNAVAAKVYSDGTLVTSNGNWWSSTANGATSRYYLRYSSSGLYSGLGDGNRYYGLSVRCVLK